MSRSRAALAVIVVTTALSDEPVTARAQTAVMPVVVQSASHHCLAVARPANGPASGPGGPAGAARPSRGWPLVVETCDGRSTQRFQQVYGDYDHFMYEAGMCLVPDPTGARVVLGECHGGERLARDPISLEGGPSTFRLDGRCMTAPAPGAAYVTLAPCDGRPEQTWMVSRR